MQRSQALARISVRSNLGEGLHWPPAQSHLIDLVRVQAVPLRPGRPDPALVAHRVDQRAVDIEQDVLTAQFSGHSSIRPGRGQAIAGQPLGAMLLLYGVCGLGSFDADCAGAGEGGLGPVAVFGPFEAVVGHLAFDDAGLAAQASVRQESFEQVVLEQDERSDQQVRGKNCPE